MNLPPPRRSKPEPVSEDEEEVPFFTFPSTKKSSEILLETGADHESYEGQSHDAPENQENTFTAGIKEIKQADQLKKSWKEYFGQGLEDFPDSNISN